MRTRSLLNLSIAMVAAITCTSFPGCASDPTTGYAFQATFRGDVASVAIPIFENDSFERSVEFELTDALIKEVEARTPYKVTSGTRADTILSGRIARIERDVISRSPLTGLNEEVVYRVYVDFEWTDLRTGRTLVHREAFEGQGVYHPSRPIGSPSEQGAIAAVQQLASDIVDELRSDW